MEQCEELFVQCDSELFGCDRVRILFASDPCGIPSLQETDTILYIQDNFAFLYDKILLDLFYMHEKGMKLEVYRPETSSFEQAMLNGYKDIHEFLGMPVITILNQYIDKGLLFYAVSFWGNDCLLSIEHGLTALFNKDMLIDLDASDYVSMLDYLNYYDRDYKKWKEGSWKKKFSKWLSD